MKKKGLILIVFIFIIVIGYYFITTRKISDNETTINNSVISDQYNASYKIDGIEYKLVNGSIDKKSDSGSASVDKVNIFEAITRGDINSDGLLDYAVILTKDSGGSGIFYYATVAVNTGTEYKSTEAVFLGDRISPQSTAIKPNILVVNYASRDEVGAIMTDRPSVVITKYLLFKDDKLIEIAYKDNLIRVYTPLPASRVSSPLIVSGQARGNWFFEADFPIVITDWDGLIIGQGVATAQDNWMTEDFVDFTAEINFIKPTYKNNGYLIIKKDNPSGLPANEDSLEIPIFFD